MSRVLMMSCAVAATALVTADAAAAGRFRARGGCNCSQPAPTPAYAAPRPAAPCCGGPAVPHAMPGVIVPSAPGVIPGSIAPAAPAAPGGHQHHSAAPPAATTLVSADLPTTADTPPAKEVTLEGTLVCAKCGLKEAGVKKCTNALQVKDGAETVTYYLDDKGNGEDYHDGLCGGGTKAGAKVTGTVTEKGGK
jgi:hypothetical protein